ncbi:MAG: hypothetical protein JWQ09_1816, partial [Segetibacter sp.]|nr:hypothetical protein [Segetibacter sp.]
NLSNVPHISSILTRRNLHKKMTISARNSHFSNVFFKTSKLESPSPKGEGAVLLNISKH